MILWITCEICAGSINALCKSSDIMKRHCIAEPLSTNSAVSLIILTSDADVLTGAPPFEKASNCVVKSRALNIAFCARPAAFIILSF